MKNKIILPLLIIATILTIAACEKDEGRTGVSYVGGTEGLKISFVDEQPPEKVLDNSAQEFSITLRLTNEGEYTIEAGKAKITLSGIRKEDFSIADLTKTNENIIDGVRKENENVIPGGQEEIIYDAKYTPDLSADIEIPIGANICYNYKTGTTSLLCLKKNVVERTKESDICRIDETKVVENSGAPIHIQKLDEMKSGTNKVRITFDIENIGLGHVYNKDAFNTGDCSKKDEDQDYVYVIIEDPGKNLNIRCERLNNGREGAVRLIEGKRSVSCEIDTSSLQTTPFETPININLEYYYLESISKKILVENAI